MKLFLAAMLLLLSALAFAVDGVAGPYRVSVTSSPDVVPIGKTKLTIKVFDAEGKPVQGADVVVLAKMPGMSMGERDAHAVPGAEPGTYSAPAVFAMAGSYDVSVAVTGNKGTGKATLNMSTGQSTAAKSSAGLPPYWPVPVVLLLGWFLLWRVKKSGQGPSIGKGFNRATAISLLFLGAAGAASIWAVKNLRRDGAMTPLEAQVMEMNTPAPEGAMPVRLAEAREQPISDTLSYSGQVVGFSEQDVSPRVSGAIVDMPVYVGSKVRKGQLLARLDTSQLAPMVAEKSAVVSNAKQGVAVAESEYSQAQAMVSQSSQEARMAVSEVEEAKALVRSASESVGAAQSGVAAAEADLASAHADLDSTQADATYQRQELARSKALFDKGALSQDEWQQSVAASARAEAALKSATGRVAKAEAAKAMAKREEARAKADSSAVKARAAKAEANASAKRSQVATAQAGAATARAKIGQSRASVSEANAGLLSATAQKGYAEIRATVDGVVSQRLVSPGVVVNPGQVILRVSQVSPVRIQANVPQADLSHIRIGDLLQVAGQPAIRAEISSVAPSVDAGSRLGLVEAVFRNANSELHPGQSVAVSISLAAGHQGLVIPSDSLVAESHGGSETYSVWIAKPATGGSLSVAKLEVKVGARSDGLVEVLSGLKPGDKVVVAPFGLVDGMAVSAPEPMAANSGGAQTVELTESGYSIPTLQISSTGPTEVTFIRRVKDTCATEVDFPELGLRKETPLNVPVKVSIPAQPAGKELTFTCPMNMFKGKAVSH